MFSGDPASAPSPLCPRSSLAQRSSEPLRLDDSGGELTAGGVFRLFRLAQNRRHAWDFLRRQHPDGGLRGPTGESYC